MSQSLENNYYRYDSNGAARAFKDFRLEFDRFGENYVITIYLMLAKKHWRYLSMMFIKELCCMKIYHFMMMSNIDYHYVCQMLDVALN